MRPAYLSKASLAAELECSETSIAEYVRTGKLPKPVAIADDCLRWRRKSIDAAKLNDPTPRQKHDDGFVYFIQCGEFVKIGTAENVERRMRGIRTNNPFDATILRIIPGGAATEQGFHIRFAHLRHRNEWFRHEGALREWLDGGDE